MESSTNHLHNKIMSQKKCFYYDTCHSLVGNSENALCLADTTEKFPICENCYKKLNIVNTYNMSFGAFVFLISYFISLFVPRELFYTEGESRGRVIYLIFIPIPLSVTCFCRMICRTHTSSPISTERLKRLDFIGSNLADVNVLIAFILLLYMW